MSTPDKDKIGQPGSKEKFEADLESIRLEESSASTTDKSQLPTVGSSDKPSTETGSPMVQPAPAPFKTSSGALSESIDQLLRPGTAGPSSNLKGWVVAAICFTGMISLIPYHGILSSIVAHKVLLLAALILLPLTIFIGVILDPGKPKARQWSYLMIAWTLNLAMSIATFQEYQNDCAMGDWTKASGIITKVMVGRDSTTGIHRLYTVSVSYRAADGKSYAQNLDREMIMKRSEEDAYKTGDPVTIFYDPHKPETAVLSTGDMNGNLKMTILATVPSVLLLIFATLWFLIAKPLAQAGVAIKRDV